MLNAIERKHGRLRSRWSLALMLGLVVLFAFPVLTGAAGNGEWRLQVRSAACVQGPKVLLGDIADPIDSIDARTWKTVSSIQLWDASHKRGRPVIITRKKLANVLRYYLGDVARNLVLPSQLAIQTGGRVLTGSELKSRVVAFLTPRANNLGGDAEFKNLRLPTQYFFSNQYDKLKISLNGPLKPGRVMIKLQTVTPDGKVVSRKSASMFMNLWKAVPVASRPLKRFERVTRDKVGFRRMNLAYNQNIWDGTGGPWRMARTLGTGQPFTKAYLEPVPLIEKGERVNLIYKGKRIQLTIKAEALGEASMGQQVSVRNLQSKKVILATVVSDDEVVVR